MKKEMTNAQIVGTIQIMGDEYGESLFKAKLPVKVLYALRKSYLAVADAYKAYEQTLNDICKRYGVTIDKAQEGGKECMDEIQELLNTKTDVNIHVIPESYLDEIDSDKYDPLTFSQLDRLQWIIEPEKESNKDTNKENNGNNPDLAQINPAN